MLSILIAEAHISVFGIQQVAATRLMVELIAWHMAIGLWKLEFLGTIIEKYFAFTGL